MRLIPLYDRSRVTRDWACPRSRYWQYEYEGRGIVPANSRLPLFLGISIHDSLSAIARHTMDGVDVPINDIAAAAEQQVREGIIGAGGTSEFAYEQAALCEGLIRGYYRNVWPRLSAEYSEILFVEEEMTYEHDGLIFMSKPDLVLRSPERDEVVYVEYKTTSSKREGWVNSWDTAVQLHSTIRAIEQTKGVKVDSVIVQGLYKGYRPYDKQNSPFCYAYRRAGNPPFTDDQISYEYRSGLKRTPVWELPEGVRGWVAGMPDSILAEQFPRTAPILINDSLVDAFFRQTTKREWTIARWQDAGDMDAIFPQRFDTCHEVYGSDCEYLRLCHGGVNDPLSEGFEWRDAHHALEAQRHLDLEMEDIHVGTASEPPN